MYCIPTWFILAFPNLEIPKIWLPWNFSPFMFPPVLPSTQDALLRAGDAQLAAKMQTLAQRWPRSDSSRVSMQVATENQGLIWVENLLDTRSFHDFWLWGEGLIVGCLEGWCFDVNGGTLGQPTWRGICHVSGEMLCVKSWVSTVSTDSTRIPILNFEQPSQSHWFSVWVDFCVGEGNPLNLACEPLVYNGCWVTKARGNTCETPWASRNAARLPLRQHYCRRRRQR